LARWSAGVIGALVCAVGIAGCGGDPAPVVTDSLSATPTASASVSATPSPSATGTAALLAQLPDGADDPGLDGAVVTAKFFVELLGEIYSSTDTSLWADLSTSDCEYCQHKVSEVADLVASGWTAEGGQVFSIANGVRGAANDDGFTYVKVPAKISDLYEIDSHGKRQLAEAASSVSFGLQMSWVDGIWRVNGVTLEDR